MLYINFESEVIRSHPSRGGWIEISPNGYNGPFEVVPPLTGWVD